MKERTAKPQPPLDEPAGTTAPTDNGVTCTVTATGATDDHIDRWFWLLVSTPDSLRALIDLLFDPPGGGAPAITSLATYLDLKASADTIQAVYSTNPAAAKSAIAAME